MRNRQLVCVIVCIFVNLSGFLISQSHGDYNRHQKKSCEMLVLLTRDHG